MANREIRELRELCDDISEEESTAHVSGTDMLSMALPPPGIQWFDQTASYSVGQSRSKYTQPPRIQALWQVYQENVAPMIAILHVPSVKAMLSKYCANDESELEPAYKALVRAMSFAAVVSMTPQQCLFILDEDHVACIQEYRVAWSRPWQKPT
jgi:hypothetical protein